MADEAIVILTQTYFNRERQFIAGDGENSITSKHGSCEAGGPYSVSEGYNCKTGGDYSYNTLTADDTSTNNGSFAHAEGNSNIARGPGSHAEGKKNYASEVASHAEGYNNLARGVGAHIEGGSGLASGTYTHVEGYHCTGSTKYSHTEGEYSLSYNQGEHAEGRYNISISGTTQHTVGIGTGTNARKNAHTITNDGKHYIPGIGTYTGTETTLPANQDLATIVNSKATITGGQNINIISQSAYNALTTKDANTLYVII